MVDRQRADQRQRRGQLLQEPSEATVDGRAPAVARELTVGRAHEEKEGGTRPIRRRPADAAGDCVVADITRGATRKSDADFHQSADPIVVCQNQSSGAIIHHRAGRVEGTASHVVMASAPVRADGRKPAMMRQMKTERNPLQRAEGSARWEQGTREARPIPAAPNRPALFSQPHHLPPRPSLPPSLPR